MDTISRTDRLKTVPHWKYIVMLPKDTGALSTLLLFETKPFRILLEVIFLGTANVILFFLTDIIENWDGIVILFPYVSIAR